MIANIEKFKGKLPYASEIYGIFQPLLGWKSRITQNRLTSSKLVLPEFPKVVQVNHPIPNPLAAAVTVDPASLIVQIGPKQSFVINRDGTIGDSTHNFDLFAENPDLVQFEIPYYLDSLIVRDIQGQVKTQLPNHAPDDKAFWVTFWTITLDKDNLSKVLNGIIDSIKGFKIGQPIPTGASADPLYPYIDYIEQTLMMFASREEALTYLFNKEIYIARYLNSFLPKPGEDPDKVGFTDKVNDILLRVIPSLSLRKILELLDPMHLAKGTGRDAVLSPIGIIHLFRQYFFEFDNFLGPPVEHIWLSPGSTTELIEASTRRVLQEQTFEQFAEAISRSETATTNQDELSQAIKDENQKDTKLGSSLSGGSNILVAHIEASGSMSVEETQKKAREENHKVSRQQSAKLSSEIRSNYKSTFRTVTEVTDMRSKRYVIENKSNELINYELRRKMRQVGVQMQPIGTQLCWQIYIDDPGMPLGVSQLVHLASKADLSQFAHIPTKPVPDPNGITQIVTILLPVPNPGDHSNLGPIAAVGAAGFVVASIPGAVVAVGALEALDSLFGGGKKKDDAYDIVPQTTIHQPFKVALPEGYELTAGEEDDVFKKGTNGQIPIRWLGLNGQLQNSPYHMTILNPAEGTCDLVVNGGKVSPGELIEFQAKIKAVPTAATIAAVTAENTAIVEQNKNKDIERDRKIKEEFVKSVKERVEFASQIKSRKTEDLREEERTVIYRNLIQKLMREAWSLSADRNLAHLRSEMIKSIFDVDKMLYFVAPEWWQPRLHESTLRTGGELPDYRSLADMKLSVASQKAITSAGRVLSKLNSERAKAKLGTLGTEDLVGWGGEGRRDNYLITEKSERARLGSSLGWLIQLDGDNLRNAFLNAPWVKAVIPVRPGKEVEALEWLKQSQVEGTDGLSELYAGDDKALFKAKLGGAKEPTIEDVLDLIAEDIKAIHDAGLEKVKEQVEFAPGHKTDIFFLAPDEVFEKGFDSLKDGFKAEFNSADKKDIFKVCDQWIEILPTDQIVAVEVKYDPKTGLQIDA